MNNLTSKLWFKVIALILINSFLLLDVAWAKGGKFLFQKQTNCLSPEVKINNQVLIDNFQNLYEVEYNRQILEEDNNKIKTAIDKSEKYYPKKKNLLFKFIIIALLTSTLPWVAGFFSIIYLLGMVIVFFAKEKVERFSTVFSILSLLTFFPFISVMLGNIIGFLNPWEYSYMGNEPVPTTIFITIPVYLGGFIGLFFIIRTVIKLTTELLVNLSRRVFTPFSWWMEKFKSGNFLDKVVAINALSKRGDLYAVKFLLEGLQDGDVRVRNAVRKSLKILGVTDEQMLEGYVKALKSSLPDVRKESAEFLGKLAKPDDLKVVKALLEGSVDEEVDVRQVSRMASEMLRVSNEQKVKKYIEVILERKVSAQLFNYTVGSLFEAMTQESGYLLIEELNKKITTDNRLSELDNEENELKQKLSKTYKNVYVEGYNVMGTQEIPSEDAWVEGYWEKKYINYEKYKRLDKELDEINKRRSQLLRKSKAHENKIRRITLELSQNIHLYLKTEGYIEDIYNLGQIFKREDLQSKEKISEMLNAIIEKGWKPSSEEVDIINIIDGKEEVVGKLDAKLAHFFSFRHRTVNAFIVLPSGRIVLQRRAHHKRSEPLAMSIYGGHVKTGQTYEQAMREELREELELPEGQELGEKLVLVGEEGAFRWDAEGNTEVRSLYVYFATEKEVPVILKNGELLEKQKKNMSKPEFEAWLLEENRKNPGHFENWGVYLEDISRLKGMKQIKVKDTFIGNTVEEQEVGFTSDLLAPIVEDDKLVEEIERVINDNTDKIENSKTKLNDIKIVGHRGIMINGKEGNTISAFKRAIDAGANALELDLQMTKDGQIVAYHNATIQGKRIPGLTLEELHELDENIPTFEDIIQLTKDKIELQIHLVWTIDMDNEAFIRKIKSYVKSWGIESNVIITSFYDRDLEILNNIFPEVKKGLITFREEYPDTEAKLKKVIERAKNLGDEYIMLPLNEGRMPEKHTIDRLHEAGFKVEIGFRAIDGKQAAEALELGADRITLDNPEILINIKKQKTLVSAAQKYVDLLSYGEDFVKDADAFLVLGNPDLKSLIQFTEKWKRLERKFGRKVKIIVAGGRGRGTLPLIDSIVKLYKPKGKISKQEENFLYRNDIYETDIMEFVFKKEGIDLNFVSKEEKPSKNTAENFTNSIVPLKRAVQGIQNPVIAIVTSPALLLRIRATAEKQWEQFKWTIKTLRTYRLDLAELSTDELIERLGYIVGYPEGYRKKFSGLNPYSELKGTQTENNPSVKNVTLTKDDWRVLEETEKAFKEFLDSLTVRYDEKQERLKVTEDRISKQKMLEGMKEIVVDKTVTFAMIKPDGYEQKEQIIQKFKNAGFEILIQRGKTLTKEEAEKFYAEHKEKPFYQGLVEYITSGPIVQLILKYNRTDKDAWEKLRDLLGEQDGSTEGSWRKELGVEVEHREGGVKINKNKIHSSAGSFTSVINELAQVEGISIRLSSDVEIEKKDLFSVPELGFSAVQFINQAI